MLRHQLRVDLALRLMIVAGVVAILAITFDFDDNGSLLSLLAIFLAVFVWIYLNNLSARASSQLPHITAMIDSDPPAAEHALAEQLRRRPLLRWIRLMLYHRLAMLRHRQHRFAESAAICHTLLMYPTGPGRDSRAQLLLMLTESRLECRDVLGAYFALQSLHETRLSLVEHLQRLTLQTRYEVTIGADRAALRAAHQKIQLVELLPAPQCGAVHAMLATAARRADQQNLARWLWQRVELLCTPEQVRRLQQGGFGVGVVQTPQRQPAGFQ